MKDALVAKWLLKISRVAFVLCLAVTLYSTLMPASDSGTGFINDKVAHWLGFLALAASFDFGFSRHRYQGIIFLVAFGYFIEWAQSFVPSRHYSIADWLADISGIATYWIILAPLSTKLPILKVRWLHIYGANKNEV